MALSPTLVKITALLCATVVGFIAYVNITSNSCSMSVVKDDLIPRNLEIENMKLKRSLAQLKSRIVKIKQDLSFIGNSSRVTERLQALNAKLMSENIELNNKIELMELKSFGSRREGSSDPSERIKFYGRSIPQARQLSRVGVDIRKTFDEFQRSVTVIIYNNLSEECLIDQLNNIVLYTPRCKVIVSTTLPFNKISVKFPRYVVLNLRSNQREGYAINRMIKMVSTKYFLYLNEGAKFSKYQSDNGAGWLLRALQSIPELDIVGGGTIREGNDVTQSAHYEISCYRLTMCYWSFHQRYEYRYSVGDMMVCEETSSSFMGRTKSFTHLEPFDENIDSMVTTDFFYRAKGKAVVGLMPEVFFLVTRRCHPSNDHDLDVSLRKQAFMDKYDLWRIVNSFGKITDYPTKPKVPRTAKSVFRKMNYIYNGGFAPPHVKEDLQFFLAFMDDFFVKKNITYKIVAGVALGGVKTRDVLPWDTGDVDTWFYELPLKIFHNEVIKYARQRGVKLNFTIHTQPDMPFIRARLVSRPFAHDDIYNSPTAHRPRPDQLMTIDINSRRIPVSRQLFAHFRKVYGADYLKMQNKKGNLVCSVPGHHACVPEEFSRGAGHWSEIYCH